MPGRYSQTTSTLLGERYVYAEVLPATCIFDDRGLLPATAVTRRDGWVKRTPNKSQHRKLTLEKKIIPPPLLSGLELATF